MNSLRTLIAWGLWCLSQTACSGCQQQPILNTSDQWGIHVDTPSDGASLQGVINGKPMLHVKGVIGKYEVSQDEESVLGALFVPKGTDLKEVAERIRTLSVDTNKTKASGSIPMQQLYALDGNAFVYCERVLKPQETGEVAFPVSFAEASIAQSGQYDVMVIVKRGDVLFVDRSSEKPTCTLTADQDRVKTSLQSATCQVDYSTVGHTTQLSAAGSLQGTKSSANYHVGFLLIKTDMKKTAQDVVTEMLKAGKSLPTATATSAKPVSYINSDVVVVPIGSPKTGDVHFTVKNIEDADRVLKLDTRYTVWAYAHTDKDYTLSTETQEICPSSMRVELKMISLSGLGIQVRDMGDGKGGVSTDTGKGCHRFYIELQGEIKNTNTTELIGGFILARDVASTAENDLINLLEKLDVAHKKKNTGVVEGEYIVVTQFDKNDTDVFGFDARKGRTVKNFMSKQFKVEGSDHDPAKMEAGDTHTYKVFAWAQDKAGTGRVFVSTNHEDFSFEMPKMPEYQEHSYEDVNVSEMTASLRKTRLTLKLKDKPAQALYLRVNDVFGGVWPSNAKEGSVDLNVTKDGSTGTLPPNQHCHVDVTAQSAHVEWTRTNFINFKAKPLQKQESINFWSQNIDGKKYTLQRCGRPNSELWIYEVGTRQLDTHSQRRETLCLDPVSDKETFKKVIKVYFDEMKIEEPARAVWYEDNNVPEDYRL